MTEIFARHLTWAFPVLFTITFSCLLILFGFFMGRRTQDKPIIEYKVKPISPEVSEFPAGDIFRDAMAGDEKEERIPTVAY